jgi:hypothetical protein
MQRRRRKMGESRSKTPENVEFNDLFATSHFISYNSTEEKV